MEPTSHLPSQATSLYIVYGSSAVVKELISVFSRKRPPLENWAVLSDEPGLLPTENLQEVQWRELFGGCACCTQAGSPVLRTTMGQMLRLRPKPSRFFLVLSADAEPLNLITMLTEYFGRVAPLRSTIMCTNNSEVPKAVNNLTYQRQLDFADILVGPYRSDGDPRSKLFVSTPASMEISFLDTYRTPGLPLFGTHVDWGASLLLEGSFVAHLLNHDLRALKAAWFIPPVFAFDPVQSEHLITAVRDIFAGNCAKFSKTGGFNFEELVVSAVLQSSRGGFQFVNLNESAAHDNAPEKRSATNRPYSTRGDSRIEILVEWNESNYELLDRSLISNAISNIELELCAFLSTNNCVRTKE